ncbi:MAG TPA: hypothetical protein VJ550_11470 [Geomonas sp.]|nr:hypothetical protein [Geomonas sp.]
MSSHRDFFILPFLLLVSAFVLLQEPFAPFANGDAAYDTGVYLYSADRMLDGALLYRDVFDHKGPLLHLLNALGLLIAGRNPVGIWLVDLACLFSFAAVMYRTASRLSGRLCGLLAVLYAFAVLSVLEPGAGSQFFALPFMAAALEVFMAQQDSGRPFSTGGLALLGGSFTCVLLLQPNLLPIWCVFGAVAGWQMLARGEYRELARTLAIAAGAALASFLPFLALGVWHGVLDDAVSCYWTFNRQYAHPDPATLAAGLRYTLASLWRSNALIPLGLYLVLLAVRRGRLPRLPLHLALAGSLLLTTVVSCALSGRNYPHYAIALLPLVCLVVGWLLGELQDRWKTGSTALVALYLVLSLKPVAWHLYYTYQAYRPAPQAAAVVAYIREHSAPGDRIQVVGNDSQLYFRSGRQSSSRYHYTTPLFEVPVRGRAMAEEFRGHLAANRPKLIIVQSQHYPVPPPYVADILERYYEKVPLAGSNLSIYRLARTPSG